MTPAEFIKAMQANGQSMEDAVEREVAVRFIHAALAAKVIDPLTSISLLLFLAGWDRTVGVGLSTPPGPESC